MIFGGGVYYGVRDIIIFGGVCSIGGEYCVRFLFYGVGSMVILFMEVRGRRFEGVFWEVEWGVVVFRNFRVDI